MCKIYLKTTNILNVPIHTYMDEFTFIVNNKKFKTTRLIADLISPTISKLHLIDPTINEFTIRTIEQGDFSNILDLADFQKKQILEKEFQFYFEVSEILGNESFEFQKEQENIEITSNNVFTLIKKHEKYQKTYSELYSKEIDFISSHFYELCENKEEEFIEISLNTLLEILNNDNFLIKSEDQLINFSFKLLNRDSKYLILFENILFENVF